MKKKNTVTLGWKINFGIRVLQEVVTTRKHNCALFIIMPKNNNNRTSFQHVCFLLS